MGIRRKILGESRVGDGQLEPVPEGAELGFGHLLDLMGGVAGLDVWPQRPALDRLGQDHRRCTAVRVRRAIRGVHLGRVMTAPPKPTELVVGEVRDELAQTWVRAEEVIPDVRASLDSVLLKLAVDRDVHLVDEQPLCVGLEQRVPLAAPHHLDDVPTGTSKHALELLDDLGVTPNRAVEALKVAVHDEDQILEVLSARKSHARQALGLVHLPVTGEAPDARTGRVGDPAGAQVAVEPGLVRGVDKTETHRHRGVLPKVTPTRVRVGSQSAADLATKAVEVGLAQPPLHERSGIDARRRVTLEEDLLPEDLLALALEEVVEPDFVEGRGRRVGRKVAANAFDLPVRSSHHDRSVPPHVVAETSLHGLVTGERRLRLRPDRIDVVGGQLRADVDSGSTSALEGTAEDLLRSTNAVHRDQGIDGVEPLLRFDRVVRAGTEVDGHELGPLTMGVWESVPTNVSG